MTEVTGLRPSFVNVHTGRTLGYEALVRGPQGQDAAWVFRQIVPGQE
ncbi:hypothetical protein [Deinococcus sp. UR1]|nr:hypothetical protein [Deinococcus sp. UR1]